MIFIILQRHFDFPDIPPNQQKYFKGSNFPCSLFQLRTNLENNFYPQKAVFVHFHGIC